MAREQRAPVTPAEVFEACEHLVASGVKDPSVRAVKDELKGGSMTTLAPLVAQWKSQRVEVKKEAVPVDPRIGALIADMVEAAANDARRDADERFQNVHADLMETAKVGREAEARIESLEISLTAAEILSQTQTGQIEALTSQLETLKRESAERISHAEEKAAREIAAANEATAKAQAEAEAARTEKAKTELRLEALPRLEADLERVRAELDQERQARVKAERELAACGAKNEGALARITDLQAAADRDRAEAARLVAGLEARISDLLASAQKERDQHSAALERLQDRLESERQAHAAAIAELQKPGKAETKK